MESTTMTTPKPVLTGPMIGDRVRSFDFHHRRDIEGPESCYMEGQITGLEHIEGCWRYKIEVTRCVFGGEECADHPPTIFPPVNGTPTWTGRTTDGVETIK